jgi:hypothetical protein
MSGKLYFTQVSLKNSTSLTEQTLNFKIKIENQATAIPPNELFVNKATSSSNYANVASSHSQLDYLWGWLTI